MRTPASVWPHGTASRARTARDSTRLPLIKGPPYLVPRRRRILRGAPGAAVGRTATFSPSATPAVGLLAIARGADSGAGGAPRVGGPGRPAATARRLPDGNFYTRAPPDYMGGP